jgi:hypothetical protein
MAKKKANKQKQESLIAEPDQQHGLDALLLELARAQKVLEDNQTAIQQVVISARTAGATWPQIGTALGVSTQAAHQRYRHHPKPPEVT